MDNNLMKEDLEVLKEKLLKNKIDLEEKQKLQDIRIRIFEKKQKDLIIQMNLIEKMFNSVLIEEKKYKKEEDNTQENGKIR